MSVRHKIECHGEVFYQRATTYKPFALCTRMRAHTWNWLGKKGQTRYNAMWQVRLYASQRMADAKARQCKREVFRNVSNEIGDNSHLEGLAYFDVVEIVRTEIAPETGSQEREQGVTTE